MTIFKYLPFILIFWSSKYQAQLKDIDGNTYATIQIGSQLWMAENLSVSRFRNGDLIPQAQSVEEWEKAGRERQPAWCYYESDSLRNFRYGKLYNWYAVNDVRGLAPENWHVPSNEEWMALADFNGGDSIAGAKLKSQASWNEKGGGSNSSGFNAISVGERYGSTFANQGYFTYWWSSTSDSYFSSWYWMLDYSNDLLFRDSYKTNNYGFSVRCIHD
jgi:uncharacterized protein (TIGR02145 family)